MALTAWQDYISKRFPGKGQAPSQEQLAQLAQEFFGNIPLPPGIDESQVVTRRGDYVEYKDQDGYVHRLTRELDGRSPNAGRVSSQVDTNRPAVATQSDAKEQELVPNLLQQLMDTFNKQAQQRQSGQQPNTGIQSWLDTLRNLTGQLSQPTALAALDPQTAAALNAIKAAEVQQLQQQFQDSQGNLIARLFGTGTNRSSMAGEQAARLLQEQGLVSAQQQSNAAQRELAVRQFLSQIGQGNLALASQNAIGGGGLALDEFSRLMQGEQAQQNSLQGFIDSLLSQALNRETSGASLGLQQRQLNQNQQQFDAQQLQQYLQWQDQVRRMDRANTWNNIFRGISTAASLASAPFTGGASLAGLFGGLGGNGGYTGATSPQFGSYGTPPLTPYR